MIRTFRTTLPRLKHNLTEQNREKVFLNFTKELSEFATVYSSKKAVIYGNADLSEAGKAKQLAELRKSVEGHVESYTGRLKSMKLADEAEAATHRPPAFKGSDNEVLNYLKAQEVRTYLNSLPVDERAALLTVPSNDPTGLLLHSVETSITPIKGLDANIIERSRAARATAFSKDGHLVMEDQEVVYEALSHNLGEVLKEL